MFKSTILFVIAVGMLLCATQPPARAQDAKQETKEETKSSGPRPITAYRLDIAINELEDGKKVNTRHYSINTTSDSSPQMLQVGTRVPMQSEEGKFTYLDVGTRISARVAPWVTPMTLNLSADISSFATADEAAKGGHPLLRQVRIEGTVPIVMDKPTIVGAADDPNSRHEFQLEVTILKRP